MKTIFRSRFFASQSDNLKSKIQNPKWVGLLAIFIAFVGLVGVAEAQQAKKVWRIGVLSGGYTQNVLLDAFRQGLRELGYVEGRTIAFELSPSRIKKHNFARYPEIATPLAPLLLSAFCIDLRMVFRIAHL